MSSMSLTDFCRMPRSPPSRLPRMRGSRLPRNACAQTCDTVRMVRAMCSRDHAAKPRRPTTPVSSMAMPQISKDGPTARRAASIVATTAAAAATAMVALDREDKFIVLDSRLLERLHEHVKAAHHPFFAVLVPVLFGNQLGVERLDLLHLGRIRFAAVGVVADDILLGIEGR